MLKCIDCGVWLIQVQSPEPSASYITLSTYLTALTHRPTLLSAHENYVEIEMSAEHLPLACKRHSINSRSGNHHSVFKNGLLSFAPEKSCWDLQHGSHIPVLRTDLQTQALIRLPISKSALASHPGGYLMSVLRAYSWLRGMAPDTYPDYWYWLYQYTDCMIPVTDCHTELQSVACIQERHTEWIQRRTPLNFRNGLTWCASWNFNSGILVYEGSWVCRWLHWSFVAFLPWPRLWCLT